MLFARSRFTAAAMALTLAAAGLFASAHDAGAEVYSIDKSHTLVAFGWERNGLSRQQGRFTDVNGTVAFDTANPEAGNVDVTIRTSSIQTGVDALDRHLRSADFFDVANHPVMTFRSTSITRTGDKTGDMTGDLTMLGVTRPVTLQVTWVFTGPHPLGQINPALRDRTVSVFSARGLLKRSAWGLSRVIPLVADDIQLTIETELLKK
jgi:polyisoprenoid-binding protein YceI